MMRILTCFTIATLALLPSAAQIQKGKTRPLETKQWMKAVNGPHCSALGKLLKEGPAGDEGWAMAAQHAQLLNESGHVLMADGRCPDAVWADACKQLRENSESVLKAVDARNTAEAQTAFQGILGACKTCHSAHRKK
jgi:cytochrome c556